MNTFVQFVMTCILLLWAYAFYRETSAWVAVILFFVLWINNICVARRTVKQCVAIATECDERNNEYIAQLEEQCRQHDDHVDELRQQVAELEEQLED